MKKTRDWLVVLGWLVFTLGLFLTAPFAQPLTVFVMLAIPAGVLLLSLTAEVAARALAVIDRRRARKHP